MSGDERAAMCNKTHNRPDPDNPTDCFDSVALLTYMSLTTLRARCATSPQPWEGRTLPPSTTSACPPLHEIAQPPLKPSAQTMPWTPFANALAS